MEAKYLQNFLNNPRIYYILAIDNSQIVYAIEPCSKYRYCPRCNNLSISAHACNLRWYQPASGSNTELPNVGRAPPQNLESISVHRLLQYGVRKKSRFLGKPYNWARWTDWAVKRKEIEGEIPRPERFVHGTLLKLGCLLFEW